MGKINFEKIFGKDRFDDSAKDAWDEKDFREMEKFTENKMRETIKEIAQKFAWTVSDNECENVADRLTDLLLNNEFFSEMM